MYQYDKYFIGKALITTDKELTDSELSVLFCKYMRKITDESLL